MAFNLFDTAKSLLGGDFIGKASSTLGESENGVQKAVSGIIPSVLAGIMNKAGSGDAGGILNMAKEAANSGVLSNMGNIFGNSNLLGKGADMLKGLFGERTNDVVSTISNYSGIKSSSAFSLMNAAAPAALGVLGKHAGETNMNAGGLLSLLNSQKDSILNALPSGLNLASALGLTSLGSIGSKLSGALSSITGGVKDMSGKLQSTAKKSSGSRWAIPALLVIAAIALIWYFTKGKRSTEPTTQETVAVTPDTTIRAVPPAPLPIETIKVKLPNGVELDAFKGGIEDQLVNFLSDPNAKIDKNTWFDFDKLNFETGSAKITAESDRQLENLASILKAFPNTAIKIGGYTDKTGDDKANMKLSQARADAVLAALKNKKVAASQLAGAEGYGSQFAKAAADAPDEERMKDRRIAVSVRKK